MFFRVIAIAMDDEENGVWSYEHAEKVINHMDDPEDTMLRLAAAFMERLEEAQAAINAQIQIDAPAIAKAKRRGDEDG